MKRILLVVTMQALCYCLFAQNVGINTATPLKVLSVNGSLLVDQNNTNLGTLDSASLLFGTNGAGIFSNKNIGVNNYNGLDFWTSNTRRLVIASNGLIGINLGANSPTAFLDVNGSIRTRNSLTANSNLTVDNNANIGGNAIVDGNITIAGTASVGGKGIVRSNSATNLRMGFTSGGFGIILPAGSTTDITFNITPFVGTNANIRVSICQFVPDSGTGDTWGRITMTVHSVDADANQCKIRFF
ncbi:MAG: hypothetical protein JWQ09_1582 [Segetibacter sp.]|nr:hypothetical protein [Segetibacter sp.]